MIAESFESRSARRGFSLAELVIVLAIIAVAAAVAIPRVASANAAFRVDGAARRLVATIEDAAVEARARSTTVRVRVSPAGNNVNAAVRTPLTYFAVYDTTDGPFEATVEEVRIANGESGLDIDGFGNFATAMIVGLKSGSHGVAVWVNPDTGTVHIGNEDEVTAFFKSDSYR